MEFGIMGDAKFGEKNTFEAYILYNIFLYISISLFISDEGIKKISRVL